MKTEVAFGASSVRCILGYGNGTLLLRQSREDLKETRGDQSSQILETEDLVWNTYPLFARGCVCSVRHLPRPSP
jgi:hypothetical protein